MATDVTEEKYNTSRKGGEKGTLKMYLVLFLQIFKYQLGCERCLLEFLSCCPSPAPSRREAKPSDDGSSPGWHNLLVPDWGEMTRNGSSIRFDSREIAFPDKHAGQWKSHIPSTSMSYCKHSEFAPFKIPGIVKIIPNPLARFGNISLFSPVTATHPSSVVTSGTFVYSPLSPPRVRADTSLTLFSPLLEILFPLL